MEMGELIGAFCPGVVDRFVDGELSRLAESDLSMVIRLLDVASSTGVINDCAKIQMKAFQFVAEKARDVLAKKCGRFDTVRGDLFLWEEKFWSSEDFSCMASVFRAIHKNGTQDMSRIWKACIVTGVLASLLEKNRRCVREEKTVSLLMRERTSRCIELGIRMKEVGLPFEEHRAGPTFSSKKLPLVTMVHNNGKVDSASYEDMMRWLRKGWVHESM